MAAPAPIGISNEIGERVRRIDLGRRWRRWRQEQARLADFGAAAGVAVIAAATGTGTMARP